MQALVLVRHKPPQSYRLLWQFTNFLPRVTLPFSRPGGRFLSKTKPITGRGRQLEVGSRPALRNSHIKRQRRRDERFNWPIPMPTRCIDYSAMAIPGGDGWRWLLAVSQIPCEFVIHYQSQEHTRPLSACSGNEKLLNYFPVLFLSRAEQMAETTADGGDFRSWGLEEAVGSGYHSRIGQIEAWRALRKGR